MTAFMGIEIGKRSIMTQQVALNITGHNIANDNTAGYSRQVGNLVTTPPYHAPFLQGNVGAGQLGTGVEIASIHRIRDSFIDGQIRNENRTFGYWSAIQGGLDKVEAILNEPTEDGLRGVMDQYWKSWQDLSANPESESVRAVVAQRAMAMADAFQHTHQQFTELCEDINATVKIKVDEINSIALQLKELNKQILAISISGQQPNDLYDKRDLLLDGLSQIADMKVSYDERGMIAVQVGGSTLVQGGEYRQLGTQQDAKGMHMVVWQDTQVKAQIEGGELRGLLDMRGQTMLPQEAVNSEYKETIPNLLTELNTLAKTIIIKTNDVHKAGYSLNNKSTLADNVDFFTIPDGTSLDREVAWAKLMNVNPQIVHDSKNIAAASAPTWQPDGSKTNFGDGTNALRLAQLKHSLNNDQAIISTDKINLPTGDLNFKVKYASQATSITVSPQANWNDLKNALQSQLDAKFGSGTIHVEFAPAGATATEQAELVFSSDDGDFQGILDFTQPTNDYYFLRVRHVTTDDYWRSLTARVGVGSQEAKRMVDNQDLLLTQLEGKRQSVSGVSLDEEMTNMIKFQHAYNAASRFITTIDEQLETIVSRMGLVGR